MDSNPKSKIKKVFYIVITLIVISALALIYINSQKPITKPAEPITELTEQQKSYILNQLGESPSVNLSDQDKQTILNNLSSGQQNGFSGQLTEEQKQNILQTLRSQ